jgi:hypothetical protein
MDTLLRDEDPEPLKLDNITRGERREIMRWYVRFPHLSVQGIYNATTLMTDTTIYREFASSSRINARFQQVIGDAKVQMGGDLLRKNYITGKYTHEALKGELDISKVSGMVQLVPTTTSNNSGSTVLPILMKASSPSRRQK